MRRERRTAVSPPREGATAEVVLLQWASETGAHGMPVPYDLERSGWHRLAKHPLFEGTWLMETPEPSPPPRVFARNGEGASASATAAGRPPLPPR
jgi:hypothetical protein